MNPIKYNKSLDMVLAAMNLMRKGQPVKAARVFAKATSQGDTLLAMRILEANNQAAYKRLRANEGVDDDDFLDEVDHLDMEDLGEIDADLDELGDVVDFDDEDDDDFEEDIVTEARTAASRRALAARSRTSASANAKAFSRALAASAKRR